MLGRIVVVVSLVGATSVAVARDYPMAGLTPDRRPEGAPVVVQNNRAPKWEERFFFGITGKRPASLAWSADQGSWYTPFDRPGMTGPYDIRGWHSRAEKKR